MTGKEGGFLGFIIGSSLGALLGWYFTKSKYEYIEHEEYESKHEVKEAERKDVKSDSNHIEAGKINPTDIRDYTQIISKAGYTDYSTAKNDINETAIKAAAPYVISPDEFGEIESYDKETLIYYEDGVLCNEDDTEMSEEDIDISVGPDFAQHIGEYEPDSVHIRNDSLGMDYEILISAKTYAEVLDSKPTSKELNTE